jgi:hypothetical protein
MQYTIINLNPISLRACSDEPAYRDIPPIPMISPINFTIKIYIALICGSGLVRSRLWKASLCAFIQFGLRLHTRLYMEATPAYVLHGM